MACMAISSWSWQSQRSDPSTSPVKHCEWIRSNGTPSVGSPMTIASADSTRRVPFDTSRSYPMASNIPHLVGMWVDATRQSGPTWTMPVMFASKELSGLSLCPRYGAAGMKLFDLASVEPELPENVVIVLAEVGRTACGFLCNAVHLHGAADRRGQLASRALERNDDVVRAQLRVIDDLGGFQNRSVRDVRFVEDFAPVLHRLPGEHVIQDCPELCGVRRLFCRIAEARIGYQIRPANADRQRLQFVRRDHQHEPAAVRRLVGIESRVRRALPIVQRIERPPGQSSGNV